MRYVYIINPVAGKGNLQSGIIDGIKSFFKGRKEEYKICTTAHHGDAGDIAVAEANKGDDIRIFACGGEGTVFEVLNGIVGYKNVELGVIPCGSANDFLKFFGQKEKFLDIGAQVEGSAVKMDIIKAGEKYCLNGCSVGMDAMIAHDMSIFKNWPLVSGSMSYKLAIVKAFLSKKLGITADISIDGGEKEKHNCLFAVIGNAPYYGGGYMGTPNAVPYDGMLDSTIVDTIFRFKVPKFLSHYQKGTHGILDYCHLGKCRKMEFWADKPIPVNLDGEIIEEKNLCFSIVEKAIDFVIPKGILTKGLTIG